METSPPLFERNSTLAANFKRRAIFILLIGGALARGPCARGDEVLYLDISRSGSNALITWTNGGAVLESSLSVTGAWTELPGAFGSRLIPATNVATFFRLRETLAPPAELAVRYLAPSFTTSIGDPVGCGCISPENPNSLAGGGNSQDNAMGSVLLHTGELTQDAVDLEILG